MATSQDQIKNMQDDLDQIKELLADNLAKTKPNGASQAAQKAGEGVRNFLSQRREQFGLAKDACEATIQNRPFVATTAAFVGGALLIALLNRRS